MKHSILWIEDGAKLDLTSLLAPVYVSGRFDPVIALDASDGLQHLMHEEFEAVIVDIRIPPGDDLEWTDLYSKLGSDRVTAKLGLEILYSLFKPEEAKIQLKDPPPPWISAEKFGVLTVESPGEMEPHLKKLSISVYEQKTAKTPHTALLKLIERIMYQDETTN